MKLKVAVSEKGNVDKVTVSEGVPGGYGFDEAAVEAAIRSKYNPATTDGKPVAGILEVEYVFKALAR